METKASDQSIRLRKQFEDKLFGLLNDSSILGQIDDFCHWNWMLDATMLKEYEKIVSVV
jgi:hypothetical protein